MNIESTSTFAAWGYLGVALVGLVILAITALASVLLVRFARKVLHLTTDGEIGGSIIANIIRVVIWALGISFILKMCLGLNPSVIWGALGVGGIALSLGLQNTVSNLIGGLQLSLSRDVSVGDWIVIGSNPAAKVIDINWRLVKLEDENGVRFLVPNSVINTTSVQVLPEPYVLLLPLSLRPGCDVSALKEEVTGLAFDKLQEAGMCYGDKRPLLSVTGTTVDSIDAALKVFALRDNTQIQINNAVMPAVLALLEERDALAHCYSG